jgi:hypothetical protein
VVLLVDRLEPVLVDVRVDLRRTDVAVAEQFLHDAQRDLAAACDRMVVVAGNAAVPSASSGVFEPYKAILR